MLIGLGYFALALAFAIAIGKAIKRADQREQPLHQRRVSDRDGFVAASHASLNMSGAKSDHA